MKNLFTTTLLLFITFHFSYAQYTYVKYFQGKNYKSVILTGYGTDSDYSQPNLIVNSFDEGKTNLYLKDIFPFMFINGDDSNLEVFFVFSDDKKNKKWKLTKYSFGCEDEKIKNFYDCLFIKEIKNISTKETLDKFQIIDKLMNSKEFVITLTDELTDKGKDNVCGWKLDRYRRKQIEKVLSPKYFSKDQDLLN